ncbi:MAG: hypothetical protein K0V04_30880 [Deltaproteobacteria bacterium]|nr:hypothetical protein [Deltaproteobacteria bacterium]
MTKPNLSPVASLSCGLLLLLTACPGDDTSILPTTGADSGTSTSSGGMVTVNPPTTMTTTGQTGSSTGVDPTTSTDPDTTSDPDSTTMPPPATDSSSGETTGPPPGDCVDVDLGMMLPVAEAANSNGFGDDFDPSCAFNGAKNAPTEDITYQWVAPADGTYIIDTLGSAIDTILVVHETDCAGVELACNDDEGSPGVLQSEITIDLTAGQQILIVVDGWEGSGDFLLNINDAGGMMGTTDTGATDTGGSGSGSGGNMGMGWGDCANFAEADVCTVDEVCVSDNPAAPTVAVCTEFGCVNAADCAPAPPGGNAPLGCGDINGDGIAEDCFIDCSAMQDCPTGMECFFDFLCVWPVGPVGGSTSSGMGSGSSGGGGIPGLDCCNANGTPGCMEPVIEACVCALDAFCCSVEWDGLCAGSATADCNAVCP